MCPCRDITGCRRIESNDTDESGEPLFLDLSSPLNAYGQGDVESGEGVKASFCLIIVFEREIVYIEHTARASHKVIAIFAGRTYNN